MARARDDLSFWSELASGALYKRNQGRLTRQLTALAIAAIVLFGCWTLSVTILSEFETPIRIGIPTALAAVGLWCAYRLVNYPRFADFLISVEAEMDKVSWPDRTYLMRATAVVLVVMFLSGIYLAAWDIIWFRLFDLIGFLDIDALQAN
jgi:preprotein translocase subunit SecE